MKTNYLHTLGLEKHREVMDRIAAELTRQPEVLFAYIHGSFLESEKFHDVDVAVYLGQAHPMMTSTALAMDLSRRLSAAAQLPMENGCECV